MAQIEQRLVDIEILKILEKEAIRNTSDQQRERFLNNTFLEKKRNGYHRRVINLKQLNIFYVVTSQWKVYII